MTAGTTLSAQEKILAALAAAMGAGCRTCAERLFALAADARIPSPELEHAIAEGLRGRQAATETMRAKAASLLGRAPGSEAIAGKELRITELCRLAAAVAANSASDALRYADAARSGGATQAAIDVGIGIARSVRSKAEGFSDEEIGGSGGEEVPCPTEAAGAPSESCACAEQSPEVVCGQPQAGAAPCGVQASGASGERKAPPARAGPAAGAERTGRLERALRSIESLRLGHSCLALGLAAGLAALYLAWCTAFGAIDELLDPSQRLSLATETRIHLVIAVLIAFFVATRRYIDQRSPLELVRLQSLTCCSEDEFVRMVEDHRASHRRRLRVATGIGALIGLMVLPATSGDAAVLLRAREWDARAVWGILTSALLFALMGRAAYESVVDGRLLGWITREIGEINLLDRHALEPFARRGLRRAFFWVGGSTIASLLALDVQRLWPLLSVLAGTLLLGTLAFLEPARSVRARLREAKQEELARVRSEIVRGKEAALRSAGGGEAARLPGLLAYEARIEAVREWPFDTPTLVRFAALALLATASWLGGAVVERLLSSVLD